MPFDATPINTTAQTLRDAAAYIEKHGWCQGTIKTSDGRVCLVGALQRGEHLAALSSNEQDSAHRAFKAVWRYLGRDPVCFNDSGYRTKETVIQALLSAADMEETHAI